MSAYAKNYGYFFNSSSGDRTYNAESFEEWLRPFFLSGVFNGELQVKAQTTPDMTVKVTAGHANLDGKAATWETENTIQLAVASGVYGRIDTIVLRRDNINRQILIDVVTGNASANPQPTAPVRDADTFELVLAEVYVGVGVTAITQANITDKRMDSDVCGYVAATVEQIDFDQIYEQYEQWQEDTQDYFTAWFESIRGQLDEDAAGHLQNEIDDLTADLDDLSTDLVADTQYYTINGNTCSEFINANRFVRLINSTVSGRADGLYFVINSISANTPVTSNDLKYPSAAGGLLNKLAGSWLNKSEIVDDLTSSRTDVALSAKQGRVLNNDLSNNTWRKSASGYTSGVNANDYTTPGFYHVGITTNSPYGAGTFYGILIVFAGNDGHCQQIALSGNNGLMYFRGRNTTSAGWSSWYRVTATNA